MKRVMYGYSLPVRIVVEFGKVVPWSRLRHMMLALGFHGILHTLHVRHHVKLSRTLEIMVSKVHPNEMKIDENRTDWI